MPCVSHSWAGSCPHGLFSEYWRSPLVTKLLCKHAVLNHCLLLWLLQAFGAGASSASKERARDEGVVSWFMSPFRVNVKTYLRGCAASLVFQDSPLPDSLLKATSPWKQQTNKRTNKQGIFQKNGNVHWEDVLFPSFPSWTHDMGLLLRRLCTSLWSSAISMIFTVASKGWSFEQLIGGKRSWQVRPTLYSQKDICMAFQTSFAVIFACRFCSGFLLHCSLLCSTWHHLRHDCYEDNS